MGMPTNQPNDVCARCCKALAPTQARWNQRYWGMAHRRCQAPAVWPPKFRPPMDPNEVMRQISALVSHLAQLTATSGLPLPQPDLPPQLANKTQSSQSQRMDLEEDQHSEMVAATNSTHQRKKPATHAQAPKLPTPPSPRQRQSSTQPTPATTTNTTITEMNTSMVVKNTSTMAEYNLHQQVKAAGGRFVMQQDEEDYRQFRWRDEPDVQRTTVADGHLEYDLFLSRWDSQKDKKQRQCKKCKRRVRRGGCRTQITLRLGL